LKSLAAENNNQQNQQLNSKFTVFLNKPFWINDPVKHEIIYHNPDPNLFHKCCFNHIIGLPTKNGEEMEMFDYEQEIEKYIKNYKNIWLKKARGLGVTEFMLRYLAFLCVSTNDYQGQRAHIITGPRIELAEEEIRRIKSLFTSKFALGQTAKDTVTLNGVTIQCFPSNALSMRGYDNVFWIMLDEADFFPPHQQLEARAVAEGYRIKSNPWIIMVSTPNKRGGIYETIEKQPEEEHGYKKLEYLYQRGLGKIYDPKEIEQEKTKGYFKREYMGLYDYDVGNLFPLHTLDIIESNGRKILDFDTVNYYTHKSLGIDVGYGSSNTAFVVTEKIDGYIRVIYAKQFNRPINEEMLQLAVNLIFHYQLNRNGNQVYVDAANPGFIRSLKIAIGESQDYENEIARWKKENAYWKPEGTMYVIPIPFNIKGEPMLEKLKDFADKSLLAVNPDVFPDLMSDLRIARVEGRKLLKEKQTNQTMDLLDALRLSTEFYDLDVTKR
jgi:hypothetical protein